MGANPDQLTEDIAATRGRMTQTVDEVRERVSPTKAIQRRAESGVEAMNDGGHAVAERARQATDEATHAGRRLMGAASDVTRDKPLLTGAAAFGAGLLAGVLLPGSDTERRATKRIQSDLDEPVRDAVGESAQHVGDAVKDRAGEAAEHVQDEARHAMDDVRDEAGEAVDAARQRADEAAQHVREEVEYRESR